MLGILISKTPNLDGVVPQRNHVHTAILLSAALMVRPGLSVIAELIPKNRDLPSAMNGGDFGWAIGLKRAIGGHYFEILLTNSNATHADQYVTSTYMGSPLNKSDTHLGFNIERRFGRVRH